MGAILPLTQILQHCLSFKFSGWGPGLNTKRERLSVISLPGRLGGPAYLVKIKSSIKLYKVKRRVNYPYSILLPKSFSHSSL